MLRNRLTGVFAGIWILLGGALLAPPVASAQGSDGSGAAERSERPVVLVAVLKVGDVDRYVTEIDIEEKKTAIQRTSTQRLVQRAEVVITVEEVTESGSRATVVLERVAFEAKGEPLNGAFDSRDPAEQDAGNLFAEAMRPIVGAPLKVELAADRTIEAITGMDGLSPTDPRAALLFESFFGEESMKNLLQLIFRMKSDPAHARVGERWMRESVDQTDFGAMRKVTEYTLESIEDGMARITIGGDIEMADSMPGNPMSTRIDSSNVSGLCLWHLPSGRLERLGAETMAVMKAGDEEFPFEHEIRSKVRIVHAPK